MRKKRKTRKVQYLLCLAGLETVCINPGNVLILIWRNVTNLIYSPQLNSDWGCSGLDLKALSDCVFLNPPLLASNIWVSPWEGGRRRGRSILLDPLSGSVCSWKWKLGMLVQLHAETCQIPGNNFTRIVLPQEMNLSQECQPEKCTNLCFYLRGPACCGSTVRH